MNLQQIKTFKSWCHVILNILRWNIQMSFDKRCKPYQLTPHISIFAFNTNWRLNHVLLLVRFTAIFKRIFIPASYFVIFKWYYLNKASFTISEFVTKYHFIIFYAKYFRGYFTLKWGLNECGNLITNFQEKMLLPIVVVLTWIRMCQSM